MSNATDFAHLLTARPLRRSLWNTLLPFSSLPMATNSGQFSFGANFRVERSFTAIRLILQNPSTTAQVLPNLCVSSSASEISATTPVLDAAGTLAPWTPVTVNGSTSVTLPAGTGNGTPIAIPSYILSDVIPLESVAAVDGSKFFRVFTRVLSPASGGYSVAVAHPETTGPYNLDSSGRGVTGYFYSGDAVSGSNQALATDANSSASAGFVSMYVAGVQFLSTQDCVTVAAFGDSLTQGYLTASGYGGYGLLASTASSSPNCAVSFISGGWTAETVSGFVGRAHALLAAGVIPHVLTIPIDSPNDYRGGTGALGRVAMQAAVLSLIDQALSLGISVVLLTSLPFTPVDNTGSVAAQRLLSAQMARSLQARGVVLLDAQAIISGFVSTAMNPATVPAGLLATDGGHYNATGHAMIGRALSGILDTLIAS